MKRKQQTEKNLYTDRVVLSPDGKFRWACEISLLRNYTTFLHATKLLLIGAAVISCIVGAGSLLAGATLLTALSRMALYMALGAGLAVVGYAVYVCLRGFRFTVYYTLDKKELHEQYIPARLTKIPEDKGFKGLINALTSRPGMPGFGIVYATGKSTSTMPMKRIRSIKPRRWLGHIKISLGIDSLHVYVPADDFDTVYDFLRSHCSSAS